MWETMRACRRLTASGCRQLSQVRCSAHSSSIPSALSLEGHWLQWLGVMLTDYIGTFGSDDFFHSLLGGSYFRFLDLRMDVDVRYLVVEAGDHLVRPVPQNFPETNQPS